MTKRQTLLKSTFFTFVLAFSYAFVPAHASHPTGVVDSSWDGFAIKGYDVVAYHTMGRAVEGNHDYSHNWLNLTWQFASAEHRDMFAADPLAYAPQYGGYCASAPHVDGKPNIDPTAFRIVNNRLYLFFSEKGADAWASNKSEVREAESIWNRVQAGLPQ
jgi:hypothetical protein